MMTQQEKETINQALAILKKYYKREDLHATNVKIVREYCQIKIAHLEHEVFAVLFLDTQHRLIEFHTMFRGTISHSAVYPREIIKTALATNAAAMILCHNHPSGEINPSEADKTITHKIQQAADLFEIRILDHIIVGLTKTYSFAEEGLI